MVKIPRRSSRRFIRGPIPGSATGSKPYKFSGSCESRITVQPIRLFHIRSNLGQEPVRRKSNRAAQSLAHPFADGFV